MPGNPIHRCYLNQADARKVITIDWHEVPPRVLVLPLREPRGKGLAGFLKDIIAAGPATRDFLLRPNTTQGKYLYEDEETGSPVLGYLFDEDLGDPRPASDWSSDGG